MGVAGAAIATDISQLVSCVLSLRFLMRVEDDYRVTAKEVRVHKKMAVRIIKWACPPVSRTWSSPFPMCWCRSASTAMVPLPWQALPPI